MHEPNKSGIENVCKELSNAFRGVLSWKWDSRLETVLAEFDISQEDSIRTILERNLGSLWDAANIADASDMVQAINNRLDGLRTGQLLFTSEPNRDALVFCAWWPWGDGKTISIRIGLSYKKVTDSEKAEKIRLFKSWFGI